MTTRIGSSDLDAALGAAVVCDLGAASAVRLEGRDARRFCNGMFTNNVRDLPAGGTNRSALVDDRARICGFLDLLCEADERFLAVLDGLDADAFVARFERFVVFDDVTLAPLGPPHASVQGPAAADALRRAGLPVPEPGRFARVGDVLVWPRVRSPRGGYDVLGPRPPLDAEVVDAGACDALRVLAGRPAFPADTGDKRLPHELGLRDELLHFEKGCYLGQETINRVDVMGQVRRRLAGVRLPPGEPPPPGAEVRMGDEVVGELTSPTVVPDGVVALAVLRVPADAPGTPVRVVAGDRTWSGTTSALPFPA